MSAHPFEIGQIWRRRGRLVRDSVIVARVDTDEFDIAVCHDSETLPVDVHPFDIILICATERDLAKWELADG